jgi:hypothetical protein
MDQDTPMNSGFGTSGVSDSDGACPTCGHNRNSKSLEQFLGKLGISDDMIRNLKSSMDNVDVDEYLNVAREYLRTGTSRAANFAMENPAKVAAGVAVLAVGAGMLLNTLRE